MRMESSHSVSSKPRSKDTDYTVEDFLRLLILFNERWTGSSTATSTTSEPVLIISSSLTRVKLSSMTPKMADLASFTVSDPRRMEQILRSSSSKSRSLILRALICLTSNLCRPLESGSPESMSRCSEEYLSPEQLQLKFEPPPGSESTDSRP